MRALLLLLLLVGSSAGATWRSTNVTGIPRDVVTPDAGVLVVATTGGAGALVYDATAGAGVVMTRQMLGNYMSAVLRGPCLMGITPAGGPSIVFDPNCASDAYGPDRGGRLRTTSTGSVYRYDWSTTSAMRLGRLDPAAGTASDSFLSLSAGGANSVYAPLSAIAMADAGEWLGSASSQTGLLVFRDTVSVGTLPVGVVRDVTLFESAGRPGAVLITDAGQLLISEDLSVADGGFFTVPVQAPFTSVTFTVAGGTQYGRGFGMATAGTEIYGAVPNPSAIGRQWVLRTPAGTPTGELTRVSCPDPSFCGGISPPGSLVWAYFNSFAPAAAPTVVAVNAGGTRAFFLDAGDPDGDPIWVTWLDGGFAWDGGDPRFITVIGPAGGSCVAPPAPAPLIAVLSDGLHETSIAVPVAVAWTAPPISLAATPATLGLTAGGSGAAVSVSNGDAGCLVPLLTWSVSPDGGFALTPGSASVAITPPATFCGSVQVFSLTGSDGADASVTVPVTLSPSPPAPLVPNPGALSLTAGNGASTVTVGLGDAGCPRPIPPLGWSISDAGGFTLAPRDGGVTITPPGTFCSGTAQLFSLTGSDGADASVSVPVTLNPSPSAPLVPAPAALTLTPGNGAARVSVGRSDAGCPDPIPPLNWSISAGSGITLSPEDGGVTVTPPASFCSGGAGVFNLTGSDSADASVSVAVTLNPSPLAGLVAAPASLSLTAGNGAASVTVGRSDAGCPGPVPPLSWSISPGGGFTLSPADGGVMVTPPLTFCSPDGGPKAFTLGGQAADASVSLPVTLLPWGTPNRPAFTSPVSQSAGTNAAYFPLPSPAHDCEGQWPFPGTELTGWVVTGGVPGVTASGGPSSLTVSSTDVCAGGTLSATAVRRVIGFPSTSAVSDPLQIQVVPAPTAITAATDFDAGFAWSSVQSELTGNFSSGADCQALRDLRASVEVLAADGGLIAADSGFAVPGRWALPVPGGCNGGSFLASASLIDDAGMRYGKTVSFAFDAGRIPARVAPLTVSVVPVSCAEGARGELELAVAATDCATQRLDWIQDGGPRLVIAPSVGAKVQFATPTHQLQEQAGQQLSFSVTATVGPGNVDTQLRSVWLRPVAFVQISHRTSAAVAMEEEALRVEVTLQNTTGCAVSGLVLEETLDGLEPIPGSVRVDGAKLEARRVGDLLEVAGLTLPAQKSITLAYLARVRLLSRAHPQAVVLMAGVDVTDTTLRPVAGCGCGSSPGGLFALLVLAGWLVRSRRRSV